MKTFFKTLLILAACITWSQKASALGFDRPNFSSATVSTQGYTVLVATAVAGIHIVVTGYDVACTTAAVWSFSTQDNLPQDILTSTKSMVGFGVMDAYDPGGLFIVPAKQALGFNMGSTNQTCGIDVRWLQLPY